MLQRTNIFTLCAILIGVFLWPAVGNAEIIVDKNAPASQQPTMGTCSGAALINIQTPRGGQVLSHNTFSKFDVDEKGVVINNADGNSFLKDKKAVKIVIEVISNAPSSIKGPIKVSGSKANVIISNPLGISFDGCNFNSIDHATLTTGSLRFGVSGLDSFHVESGTIRIYGNGLDASNAENVDIISRELVIKGKFQFKHNGLKMTVGGEHDIDENHEIQTSTYADNTNDWWK